MSTLQPSPSRADPGVDRTVVVVGPTASGKSGLAIALAERLIAEGRPAEIVNADSMLVYRGMDIGTAKPSAAERQRVVHHLVDVLEVTETATVAQFQTRARKAIADCRARAVVPIVVGGSALYIRAIVDDFVFPGTDPAVRARWEAELAEVGSPALHERLARLDPGGRRRHRAGERSSGRPGPGGHRADRAAVPRTAPRAALSAAGGGPARVCGWSVRSWTYGSSSGSPPCGPPGWSTRSPGWRSTGCGRA